MMAQLEVVPDLQRQLKALESRNQNLSIELEEARNLQASNTALKVTWGGRVAQEHGTGEPVTILGRAFSGRCFRRISLARVSCACRAGFCSGFIGKCPGDVQYSHRKGSFNAGAASPSCQQARSRDPEIRGLFHATFESSWNPACPDCGIEAVDKTIDSVARIPVWFPSLQRRASLAERQAQTLEAVNARCAEQLKALQSGMESILGERADLISALQACDPLRATLLRFNSWVGGE